jgi:hypothetical protein
MSSHGYTEPIAKAFPLIAMLAPSSYSNSTYYTNAIDCSSARAFLATLQLGANVHSSSTVVAYFQHSSVSTATNSNWGIVDYLNAALRFDGPIYPGIAPGQSKSLELRAEVLNNRLPINAARYVRLAVTVASSASTTDLGLTVNGSFWRYPPTSGPFFNGQSSYLSSSVLNVIYTSVNNGGTINVT